MPLKFPVTPGGDFAGIVTERGEGVTEYESGDEVYGTASVLSGASGAYVQVATAAIGKITTKPKTISFVEAAALPVAGVSAVQAIEENFRLQSGQKILIHGGAGGIGHMAIQLAKAKGAHVATTVRADDIEYVKSLGADEAVDYKTQAFETLLKDYDAAFDTVGGEVMRKSFQVLRKGAILVSMLGQPDKELAEQYEVTAIGQNTQVDTSHLNRLTELVDKGIIKVNIDKIFPLDQVREAFVHLQTGHPRGKVVLTLKE